MFFYLYELRLKGFLTVCLDIHHVQRMRDDRLLKRILSAEVPGVRGRGRPRRSIIDSVRSNLEVRGLGWTSRLLL